MVGIIFIVYMYVMVVMCVIGVTKTNEKEFPAFSAATLIGRSHRSSTRIMFRTEPNSLVFEIFNDTFLRRFGGEQYARHTAARMRAGAYKIQPLHILASVVRAEPSGLCEARFYAESIAVHRKELRLEIVGRERLQHIDVRSEILETELLL